MSDKTDYKKLWRREKAKNLEMFKQVELARNDFKRIFAIPGVKELIENNFKKQAQEKEAQNGRNKKTDAVRSDTKKTQ